MLRESRESTLRAVQRKFEWWRARRKKRKPIPPELLALIPALAKTCPLSRLAKVLRVNYYTLKKAAMDDGYGSKRQGRSTDKSREAPASFVEIPMIPPSAELHRMAAMDVETPRGIKVHVTAGDDPAGCVGGWLKLFLAEHP